MLFFFFFSFELKIVYNQFVKKNPNNFKNITVILPIIDETFSINKTVSVLLKNNNSEIKKIAFILHKKN